MQNYLNHLLSDLRAAKKNAPPEPDFSETYEEFEKTMLEIENAPKVDPKALLGISYE
jgi:hypothetical protein